MYVKKARRVIRKRPARAVRRSKPKVSLAIKSYVKKAIHSKQENKSIQYFKSVDFGSYTNSTVLNVSALTPVTGGFGMSLTQGVGQNQRIGNQIKVRRVMLNYVIRPNPQNATTNTTPAPMDVLFYLGNVKQIKGEVPSTSDISLLYQLNGSALPPTGDIADQILPINKDHWCMYKTWINKIGWANQSSIPTSSYYNYTNNDYKVNVVRRMDVTKWVQKTMTFDDNNGNNQGPNLFFMYQAVRCDGLTLTSTQTPCHIDFYVTLDYEDA